MIAARWSGILAMGVMALLAKPGNAQDVPETQAENMSAGAQVSTSASPDTGACLTLEEAFSVATGRGPELSLARANAAAAEARLRQERGTAFPQVSAYARAAEGDTGLVDGRTNTQTGIAVSQRLFDFGQSGARRRALTARRRAAMFDTGEAELDLQEDAGLAFLGILELEELVQNAKRREARYGALTQGVPRRLEAGLITIATASSIRAEVAAAHADRVEREAALASAQVRFETLVGPGAHPCPAHVAAADELIADRTGAASLADVVVRAPGVRAAEARIDAARADIDVARRIQRPEVSVQAVGAYQYDRLVSEWKTARRVGLDVTMPLFGGGSFGGERDEAVARLAGAQAEAERERRDVTERLASSLRRADAFAALADAREDEVAALTTEVDAVRRQFDEGLRPYHEYERAEAALAAAEAEAIQARYRALRERLAIAVLSQSLPTYAAEEPGS